MVSRHIAFSESIVLRELEKIARKTNLIPEEPKMEKTASAPEKVEQDTVSILESSEDLMADVMVLASQLRSRGFNKQAEALESKAILLKKAMAEGSHDSLYNFWKETGESVINFAHKTTDANVEGYKPKNLNEVRQSITSTLSQQPTGNQEKAIRLAQKVTYVLKKMGQQPKSQSTADVFTGPTNKQSVAPVQPASTSGGNASSWIQKLTTEKWRLSYDQLYGKQEQSQGVDKLAELGYLDINNGTISDKVPEASESGVKEIEFLGGLIPKVTEKIRAFGPNAANFIKWILTNDVASASNYLKNDVYNPSSWKASDKAFANLWSLTATEDKGGLDDWNEWFGGRVVPGSPLTAEDIAKKNADDGAWNLGALKDKQTQNLLASVFDPAKLKVLIENYLNAYTSDVPQFTQMMEYYNAVTTAAKATAESIRKAYMKVPENDPRKSVLQKNYNQFVEIASKGRDQLASFQKDLAATDPTFGGSVQDAVDAITSWKVKADTLIKNLDEAAVAANAKQ